MHVNRGAGFGEPKSGAGMIEVDMTQKNMAYIGWFDPKTPQTFNYVVKRGFRTGIKQRDSIIRFQSSRGNDAGTAELQRINDVRIQKISYSRRKGAPCKVETHA